jgi:RHS repeat-associated protein
LVGISAQCKSLLTTIKSLNASAIVSTIELDPWGADTPRSNNAAFQPRKFTSYERDGNGSDEAMFRRYNRWQSRFDQPDPYDGSYDATDPQSFNRYAYVQNDPVNFTDPTGLLQALVPVCPDGNPCPIDFGGVTVFVSWADQIDASTGGPPEFGGVIRRGDPNPRPGGGGRGGGVQEFNHPQKEKTTDRKLEECVLATLGKFLKAEVVTQLKGLAARAGLALGVYLGGALTEIAGAELAADALGWGGLTAIHTLGGSFIFRGASYLFGYEVVRNTIEQFNNRKELLSGLRSCYSSL